MEDIIVAINVELGKLIHEKERTYYVSDEYREILRKEIALLEAQSALLKYL